MEPNLPIIAKKLCSMVRVMFFMLRKGISKTKLMFDLNMQIVKRGNKICTKALHNLTLHAHHHNHRNHQHDVSPPFPIPPDAYEFSCSSTPSHTSTLPFHLNKLIRRNHRHHNQTNHFFGCALQAPKTSDEDKDSVVSLNDVKLALEMLNNDGIVEASPWLPGFGKSPMVRQLRITDSPFPVQDDGDGGAVDKKAEEFIKKFYQELNQQKSDD